MTLEELIRRTREQINANIAARNSLTTQVEELRAAETPDQEQISARLVERSKLDTERAELEKKLEDLQKELREDEAVLRLQSRLTATEAPSDGTERDAGAARVGAEPRTYSRESDPQGRQFIADVIGDLLGNRDARERLSRHMAEERVERAGAVQRAVTTSGAPGLVIPQYLVELYAPKGRPGRRFADACRHHDLPETGMTVYIPRQVATTEVGIQAAELAQVAEADYEDELIAVPVRTAAGSQTISRQSAERSLGTEDIVLEDLLKSYDTNLDTQLINAATWGLLAVANTVTYTDDDPTAAELYRKILGAKANAEDVLQDLDEDDLFVLMRGRRWAWLNGETTDQHPFVQKAGVPAEQFATSNGAGYASAVRGFLPDGGAVITDNNLPKNQGAGTNQDVVVVVAQHEAHLWEDPNAPFYIRAEQTQAKKLGIDLVVYGYFAACFNRIVDEQGSPKAVHQQIAGTGLVAPTF